MTSSRLSAPVRPDVAFALASRERRADPHPLLRQMREQAPVCRCAGRASGRVFWYLTRHADVRRAAGAPELGRQLDRLPGGLAALHRRWESDPLPELRRNVFNVDPPDHTRLRRLITPAFGARAVAAAAPCIRRAVSQLTDQMAATDGPVDVVGSLALPLPGLVAAEVIGFPADGQARLRGWSGEIARSRSPERARQAGLEFIAYLLGQLGERRARPDQSLFSALIQAQAGGQISHGELISSVFQLLLAGDETTVYLIGNAVLELLRHPGQLARLRAQPELIDSAVEEAMRFNGPVGHSRPLYALADVEIGGSVIPRGDIVVPVLLAANRDPAVFGEPDVFDIGRTPNRHLGFGHGIHFCLGAALARLQARAAVGTLVRRFPALSLAAGPAELEWTPGLFLHGVRHLPVLLRSR